MSVSTGEVKKLNISNIHSTATHASTQTITSQPKEFSGMSRRYVLADTLGVPYMVTVDREMLENNTVTIRERGTKRRERAQLQNLVERLCENSIRTLRS